MQPTPSLSAVLSSLLSAHSELSGALQVAGAVVRSDGKVEESWGQSADNRTVFRIASMTKSFSAALVLMLRDEGVLELDRPIANYERELASVVGPGASPKAITLRDLLSMSSGLVTDDPWADAHLDATDDELDEWIRGGLRFAHPTGTQFEYSNLGFALVGRVVHRVTGQRLQDLVSSRILGPLGMAHTVWDEDSLPLGSEIATGWTLATGALTKVKPLGDGVIAPMGGLWSNCEDLAVWVGLMSRAFLDDDNTGPIRKSTLREMQQIQRGYGTRASTGIDGLEFRVNGGYGFGLNIHLDAQATSIWHSGGLPGYGSTMRWVPGGNGVVLLANLTYAQMTVAGARLMDALRKHGHLAMASKPIDPDAEGVARALVELFNDWTAEKANILFADNVFNDASNSVRRAEVTAKLSGQKAEYVSVDHDSGPILTLRVGPRVHRIEFSFAPITPAQIQWYSWLT